MTKKLIFIGVGVLIIGYIGFKIRKRPKMHTISIKQKESPES